MWLQNQREKEKNEIEKLYNQALLNLSNPTSSQTPCTFMLQFKIHKISILVSCYIHDNKNFFVSN